MLQDGASLWEKLLAACSPGSRVANGPGPPLMFRLGPMALMMCWYYIILICRATWSYSASFWVVFKAQTGNEYIYTLIGCCYIGWYCEITEERPLIWEWHIAKLGFDLGFLGILLHYAQHQNHCVHANNKFFIIWKAQTQEDDLFLSVRISVNSTMCKICCLFCFPADKAHFLRHLLHFSYCWRHPWAGECLLISTKPERVQGGQGYMASCPLSFSYSAKAQPLFFMHKLFRLFPPWSTG